MMCRFSRKFFVSLVFSFIFVPLIASAQLPDKTLEKFDTRVWREYTRNILLKVRPEDKALINDLTIVISGGEEANVYCIWQVSLLYVPYGFIKKIDSEDEYAFAMAHELEHLILKPQYPTKNFKNGSMGTNFKKLFNIERAADKFARYALKKVGFNPCIGYLSIRKTLSGGMSLYQSNPFDEVIIKRIKMMAADCKESPSQAIQAN